MHKILIVDDDPTLVDFLKLLLESEGYETAEAYDGKMALEQIARESPQVVLLDYMMPNMHGLDVLKNVSANYNSSFVVMLTGKGSEEVAVECMKAGAADYVVKPFDNDYLISTIRNVLRLREVELEKRALGNELHKKRKELLTLVDEAISRTESLPDERELKSLLTQIRNKLK